MQAMYATKCPSCGSKDELYVIGGVFEAAGLRLYRDGFDLGAAKAVNTQDETVRCNSCGRHLNLADLQVCRRPRLLRLKNNTREEPA